MTTMSRALVVRGGWEGHEPVQTSERVIPLLEEAGLSVTVSDSLEVYADAALMAGVDLVVQCWTMGTISRAELDGLLSAVRAGTGIGGWHGGLCDAFRNATDFQFMTGGQWVAHPGGKVDFSVQMDAAHASHPIVEGLGDFSLRSEQYYLHVDPSNDVLATTTCHAQAEAPWIEGCVMPVAWTRHFGSGRVFYSSLGHDAHDFDVPEVLELTRRGLLWAVRDERRGGSQPRADGMGRP